MIFVWLVVVGVAFWWAHNKLERFVNSQVAQLHDQLHTANDRIASLEGDLERLQQAVDKLDRRVDNCMPLPRMVDDD